MRKTLHKKRSIIFLPVKYIKKERLLKKYFEQFEFSVDIGGGYVMI